MITCKRKIHIGLIIMLSILLHFSQNLSYADQRINPATDLEYLGAFRIPTEKSNDTSFGFTQFGMTYYTGGDVNGPSDGHPGSLFGISHPYQTYVAEFSIPKPIISPDKKLSDLNTATMLQNFTDVADGRQDFENGLKAGIGDVQYLPQLGSQKTDKLYWVRYNFYNPPTDAPTFGWCELDFSNLNSKGVWKTAITTGRTSKYMFEIPKSWADSYVSSRYLGVGRKRVLSGMSFGPSLYTIAPWEYGNPPADGTTFDTSLLLQYDQNNPIQNFSFADDWVDGAWIEIGDKSAIIFAGVKGIRTASDFGGTEYYKKHSSYWPYGCNHGGWEAEPYYGSILFFDVNDIQNVVNGKKMPYEPKPYAFFQAMPLMFNDGSCKKERLGGIGYDRTNNLLYIMENSVDGKYEPVPIIHVWKLLDAGKSADIRPPSSPTNLSWNNDTKTINWTASTDDHGGIIYVVYRDNEPVMITTSPTWTDEYFSEPIPNNYTIEAWDAPGNRSSKSKTLVVNSDGSYNLVDSSDKPVESLSGPANLKITN